MLPRGSTRVEAGDRLHVVVRSEVANADGRAARALGDGPLGEDTAKPAARARGRPGVFTSRPWDEEADGDAAASEELLGVAVREHLRTRRDRRGALSCSPTAATPSPDPTLAVGGARQLQAYARRRLARETDETARAWWQEVIGALAR